MFDIGFSELVLIALVALIVLGPQRLPEVARTAGRWAGQARRFMDSVKSDFDREIASTELEEFRNLQREVEKEVTETRNLIEAPLQSLIEPEKTPEPAPELEQPRLETTPSPVTAEATPRENTAAPVKRRTRRAAPATKPKAVRKKHGGTTKRNAG